MQSKKNNTRFFILIYKQVKRRSNDHNMPLLTMDVVEV